MSIKDRLENLRAYSRYAIIRQFFRIMGVKPIHIILPTVLAFISAAFNFINLGLIVLLVKGAVGNSFDFIQKTARLKYIVMLFPRIFSGTHIHNNNAFLFLIGLIFLCGVLKTVTHYANTVLVAYWHGRFRCSIYEFVFERFLTFGKLFFDKTNYGYMASARTSSSVTSWW